MTDLEMRAYAAMREAFCRLRYLGKHPLNELGRKHMFYVADAAHNFPGVLSGETYHLHTFERDLLALEAMLEEPYAVALAKYRIWDEPRATWLQKLRSAIGIGPGKRRA